MACRKNFIRFWQKLFEIILNPAVSKLSHDIKFTLRTLGFEPRGTIVKCFDTALAKYCIDPSGEFSLLGALAVNLNVLISPTADIREKMALYAANIWALKTKLEQLLDEHKQRGVFADMEIPLMTVLLDMEINGIMVDKAWLKTLEILLAKELETEQNEINKIAGRPAPPPAARG